MDRRSFLVATASLPLLAGCAGRGGDGTVRFEGWDYEAQLVQRNIDRFTRLNPDVPVSYTPITSAQFIQKITAEFLGGGGPDVLYMYDDSLAGSVDAEYLQPLDDIPGIDAIYDAIYPSNATAMTYQEKRWGLPYYTDMQSLVYNADILAKAGISAPPASLDELEQQALRIKRAGLLEYPLGVPAQLADTAAMWLWALVFANGNDLFDHDLQPHMGPLTGVFEWVQRVSRQSKVLDPACVQLLPVPMDNAVMAGRYAFVLAPRYALRTYNDPAKSKTAGKIKMAQVPSLDGHSQGTVSSTRMYCLNGSTRVPDKAVRLLKYLGGFDSTGLPYTAKYWFTQRGLGFPFRSLATDPDVRTVLGKFADPTVYAQLAQVARARIGTAAPWYPQFEQAMQQATQQVLIGSATPAAATASLDASARSLARSFA